MIKINNIAYKVLPRAPRTLKNGDLNPYILKVKMVNKPYMTSYYMPEEIDMNLWARIKQQIYFFFHPEAHDNHLRNKDQ